MNNGLLTGTRRLSVPELSGARVDVRDFGAKLDGVYEDQFAFQKALSYCESKGGGQVFFEGLAALGIGGVSPTVPNAKIAISVPDRCGIIGVGRSASILTVKPNTQVIGVELFNGGSNQVLMDFTIECNKANQTDSGIDGGQVGVYATANFQTHLQRVHVKNSIREGFYLSNGGWGTFFDMLAEECVRSGFEVDALQYCDIVGFHALNNLAAGIRLVGAGSLAGAVGPVSVIGGMAFGNNFGMDVIFNRGSRIIGFKARRNVEDGILVRDSADIGIIGCLGTENERQGLYLLDSSSIQVSGGWWNSNNYLGAKSGVGIFINNTVDSSISGNRCNDHQGTVRQLFGIEEAGTSNNNEISSNNVTGNADGPMKIIGSTTRASSNTGANPLPATITSPVTVANTVTETVIGTLTVPSYLLTPGSIIRIAASGVAGTHSSGTVTLTFRVRVNGVTGNIITNVVITEAISQTAKGWYLDTLCTVRTTGTGGTVIGNMQCTNELTTTLAQAVKSSGTAATVVMNTTVSNAVVLTVQHGAAIAANTVSLHNLSMDVSRV